MPEMRGIYTKKKENKTLDEILETRVLRHTHQNELDKACFQHGKDFKDLPRRTALDKVLHDKRIWFC